MPTVRKHASPADRQAAYRKRMEQARAEQLAAKGLPPQPPIPTMPGSRRWNTAMRQAEAALRRIVEEMQDYHDERLEAWQEGDSGQTMQERIDALLEVANALEEMLI